MPGDRLQEVGALERQEHRRTDSGDRCRPRDVLEEGDLADTDASIGDGPEGPATLRDGEFARLEDVVALADVALADEDLPWFEGEPAGLADDALELWRGKRLEEWDGAKELARGSAPASCGPSSGGRAN
jgi:hypothetical protein